MTNHPGRRKPGSAQCRMTPEALRDIIARAGITQARAAELAGVQLRTMQQYLAGDRAMPLSASGLLAVSCILLGAPSGLLRPYLPTAVAEQLTRQPPNEHPHE
jgi:transcriptional regulator with XRE-family HTH domain